MGEKWPKNFAWKSDFHNNFQGSLTCRKSVTWDRRLYFPSEGRRAEDFFTRKIQQLRPGSNPRSWVPEASMLTTPPPKPLRAGGQGLFSSPRHPEKFRGPPSLLFSGQCEPQWLRLKGDNSLPSSSKAKNAWGYISTHPYAFMAYKGTTVPLQYIIMPLYRTYTDSYYTIHINLNYWKKFEDSLKVSHLIDWLYQYNAGESLGTQYWPRATYYNEGRANFINIEYIRYTSYNVVINTIFIWQQKICVKGTVDSVEFSFYLHTVLISITLLSANTWQYWKSIVIFIASGVKMWICVLLACYGTASLFLGLRYEK